MQYMLAFDLLTIQAKSFGQQQGSNSVRTQGERLLEPILRRILLGIFLQQYALGAIAARCTFQTFNIRGQELGRAVIKVMIGLMVVVEKISPSIKTNYCAVAILYQKSIAPQSTMHMRLSPPWCKENGRLV